MDVVIYNADGSIVAVHLSRDPDNLSVLDERESITADWDRDWDSKDKQVIDGEVVDK